MRWQIHPLGDDAVLFSAGNEISLEHNEQVTQLCYLLEQHPFPGFTEAQPAYSSLAVHFDCRIFLDFLNGRPLLAWLESYTTSLAEDVLLELDVVRAKVLRIPVCYGGEFGPDLESLAKEKGVSPETIIEWHSQNIYHVFMCGFKPGFPYMGLLSEDLACKRKLTPRLSVPAGSVGLAGRQTGIYPTSSPGGWQIIGRTPLSLFEPEKDEPFLFSAGMQVEFYALSKREFIEWR